MGQEFTGVTVGESLPNGARARPKRDVDKAAYRNAFFAKHPRCCYCYGERAATEIDHAPARICFRQKVGPEDLEFPSCGPCNRAVALSEQVAALFIRLTDQNGANFEFTDLEKVMEGVGNNAPAAVPLLDPRIIELLEVAHSKGIDPANVPELQAPPSFYIPPAAHEHLELFATKMLYAMYYRVSGTFAGPRNRRHAHFAQIGTPAAALNAKQAEAWFGDLNVGQRQNIDLGDQFHYRHGYNEAHGFLGLSMSFGQSLHFFCVIGPSKQMEKLDFKVKRFQPIRELGVAVRRRTALPVRRTSKPR